MNMPLYALTQEYRALAVRLAEGDFDRRPSPTPWKPAACPSRSATRPRAAKWSRARSRQTSRDRRRDQAPAGTEEGAPGRADALRDYLLRNMIASDIQVIECPLFRISIAKNPPAVEVFDEKQIPADYFISPPAPPPKLDKTLIAQALKDNHDVPGARLRQGVRLAIR